MKTHTDQSTRLFIPVDPYGFRWEGRQCMGNPDMMMVSVSKVDPARGDFIEKREQLCATDQIIWFLRAAESDITNTIAAEKANAYREQTGRSYNE